MHQTSEEKLPELKNKSLESEFSIFLQILPSKMEEIMWISSRRHKSAAWRN
jgi:hypothetical protein